MQPHHSVPISLIPNIPDLSNQPLPPNNAMIGAFLHCLDLDKPQIRFNRTLGPYSCDITIPNNQLICAVDRAGCASGGCEKPSRVAALHPTIYLKLGASAEGVSAKQRWGGLFYTKAVGLAVENSKVNFEIIPSHLKMRSSAILLSLSALFVSSFAAPATPDYHVPIYHGPGHVDRRGVPSVEVIAVGLCPGGIMYAFGCWMVPITWMGEVSRMYN